LAVRLPPLTAHTAAAAECSTTTTTTTTEDAIRPLQHVRRWGLAKAQRDGTQG
jgi:hypothetical protein